MIHVNSKFHKILVACVVGSFLCVAIVALWLYVSVRANLLGYLHTLRDKEGYVSLQQIPQVLKNATVVAEDPGFYKRLPFGGSLITQQLVKLYIEKDKKYLGNNLEYNLQILFLSFCLDTSVFRDMQLELHLNKSWYGLGIQGVSQAAKIYFNKSTEHLNPTESIVLAGLTRSPALYDLRQGEVDSELNILWLQRAKDISRHMKEYGFEDQLDDMEITVYLLSHTQ